MAPSVIETPTEPRHYSKTSNVTPETTNGVNKPKLVRMSAKDPSTTCSAVIEVIERDGGVIIENLVSDTLVTQIKRDLAPYYDSDTGGTSHFFPSTTSRATGLLGISSACVELALSPLFSAVADAMLTSTYTHWYGKVLKTSVSRPQISSTVGFRVNPGGTQQGLHRDDADYHTTDTEMPVMLGCVTAITKTTKENGATIVIPGSHKWSADRAPLDEEAIPAELEPGSALMFLGHTYHAGGGNTTKDEARETVGIFVCKGYYRQAENQYLMVPPELAKERELSPAALRLLGYGISEPMVGFKDYMDPMRSVFGIEDDQIVEL